MEKESTRNYGIDLLRLFAMYLIVVLHVLGQGGVLNSENAVGTRYAVAWFLEICAYCSVDCYALISGYVGYRDRETPYRYSKFLSFWVPVFFYSLGIALVAALVDPDAVNAERMWKSVFPVTTSRYWYITAYAGLFFVIPWLNRLLRGCTDRELTRVAIGIFVIFCCFNAVSIVYGGGLSLAGGYSFVWLALLYVLGACLKRTGIAEKFRSRVWLLAAFLAVLVTWLFKVFMPTRPVNDALISYTSPTITLVAVALLAVFSRLRPQGIWRKLIGFFAPAALGVYLIHVHWYIFYFPLNNAFAWVLSLRVRYIPFAVLGCALGIFLGCLVVERIRLSLFSWLKIDQLIADCQTRLDRRFDKSQPPRESLWRQNKRCDCYFFGFLMVCLSVMLLAKCRYGIGNIDESFYLTIPYRLVQGDSLFLEEWHLSQMAGFLTMPFMRLFLWLRGGTDGIILAFRYLYVAVQVAAGITIYGFLRKRSRLGAVLAGCLWTVYAPFNIMALSYNSMGIICLTLALVLITCGGGRISWLLGGIFLAAAVLCCPYLAILWLLYGLAVLGSRWRKNDLPLFQGKRFLLVTLGAGILAAIFLGQVFSQITLSQLFAVLPSILSDPEHQTDFLSKVSRYFQSIWDGTPITPVLCVLYILVTALGTFSKKKITKDLGLAAVLVLTGAQLIGFLAANRYINYLMLPINFAALYCVLAYGNKDLSPLFWGIWVPGMLYTFCLHLSSNQALYAISSASAVPMVASVMILVKTVPTLQVQPKALRRSLCVLLAALVLLQAGGEWHCRWNDVFWETSIKTQTDLLTDGPSAGLLVPDVRRESYEAYLQDISLLDTRDNVLMLSNNTWLYLCGTWKNAAYSAWLSGVNDASIARLKTYYEINPDKIPQYIFVDSQFTDYAAAFPDYTVVQTTASGALILKQA